MLCLILELLSFMFPFCDILSGYTLFAKAAASIKELTFFDKKKKKRQCWRSIMTSFGFMLDFLRHTGISGLANFLNGII